MTANTTVVKVPAVTLVQAAKALDLREGYVRTLLRNKKIAGAYLEPVSEDSSVKRWMIPQAWIDARKTNGTTRVARRADGRNRYVLYATGDELTKIKELAAKAAPGVIVEKPKAYKPKAKKAKAAPAAEATK